jgi:predicted ATPase/class 3 adenylate cyclase/TolA-binding protein
MPSLPNGTVTFLFTDIEGSTKLWEQHPEAMRLALARHDALLRSAIEQHEGHIFKTIGDAFCAAFHTAPEALNAALAAQQTLISEPWPEAVTIKVRMALHTGAAEARDNDYFGQPLNRVARLLAAGYGGQVLLSSPTQDLTRDALPPSARLKGLGEHRLRDLNRPEMVYQLLHPALPAEFAPLKSLDSAALPNNLPRQLTSFIGREKEVADVTGLLTKISLLTLTGSGGCGKTRLSLQVAADMLEQFPDGVWLVELAPLADPALVPQTVASALNLAEQVGKSFTQTLTEHLKSRRLLLILDNCEHLLSACAHLSDALLRACPQIKILASSREGLGIAGELTYRVPSLSLPDPKQSVTVESVSQYEAVRLFIERALFHLPGFAVTNQNAPALASVCHRLDGIPLAIELAAARVKSLSVEEINTRLDNRFRLLTGGSKTALPRQQTLRALIDWSYGLLNAQEKVLLTRLSVFSGGWMLAAAESVCCADEAVGIGQHQSDRGTPAAGKAIEAPPLLPTAHCPLPDFEVLDLLSGLADKSLVIAEPQGETTRYRLLETVRQYARDRLAEREESMVVRLRHRDYFLTLAEAAGPKLRGAEQAQWLSVLEAEHDNLRQALTFCLEEPEGGEAGLRLGAALWQFWLVRGHLSEGRQHLAAVLSRPMESVSMTARAQALYGAGVLASMQGDYGTARILYDEGLVIVRELGDMLGVANSLHNLGNVAADQGDNAAALALYEESLAMRRELGNQQGIAASLLNLGTVAQDQGDWAAARVRYEESLTLFRELGDERSIAVALLNLGTVAHDLGDYAPARALHQESVTIFRALGDKLGIANALYCLGTVVRDQGDYATARALHEESLATRRELGDKRGIANSLSGLGNVAHDQGDYATAHTFHQESLTTRRELGDRHGIAVALLNLGTVEQDLGDWAAARARYEESLTIFRELGDKRSIASTVMNLGTVAHEQGDYSTARARYEESLTIRRELEDNRGIAHSLDGYALLACREQQPQRAARLWGAATSLREAIGLPRAPIEQNEYELNVAPMRVALGETAFTVAFEEGRAMTGEQAADYATVFLE